MMVDTKTEGDVTHKVLANTMPFYCCWLVDKDDDSKPCIASVPAGSALYSVQYYDIVPPKTWINQRLTLYSRYDKEKLKN